MRFLSFCTETWSIYMHIVSLCVSAIIFNLPSLHDCFGFMKLAKMESLSSNILISSAHTKFPGSNYINSPHLRTHFHDFSLILHSKKSIYQDFQEYAKPSRLLPAMEVKIGKDALDEKEVTSFLSGRAECFYKVKLRTSNAYGSDLTDLNSGVLICLIDENGSSVLQRLHATSVGNSMWSADKVMHDILHFQRSSVDEFVFEGPTLGRIVAVWIGLESGQWRIGGISLTVICHSQPPSSEDHQISKQLTGFQYDFEVEDILLGGKSEISMMEFRPYPVIALSEDDFTSFHEKALHPSSSLNSCLVSNEKSMKEYGDLKFSLLFYDAMLILAGSSIISFTTGENGSYAFVTGGMSGFLFLLLLQRSVDGLPVQELVLGKRKGNFGQFFERFRVPISSLVLVFAFAAIIVKCASGEGGVQFTPKDIVFGMMGFLMCKVSVVLAAFKPMPFGLRENK